MAKKIKKRSKKKNEDKLITAISIINYVYAVLLLLAAVFVLIGGTILTSLGGTILLKKMLPTGIASGMLGGILIVAAVFLAGLGIFYIYLGKGIAMRKYWAKIAQIIVAIIIHLFSFPLGTAIAIFELYVLLINKETKDLFTK